MTYETLTYEVADNVATITLMRPDAANALNGQAFREIWQAALAADDDPAVRAVIITATGRMFCSGGDLKDFSSRGDDLPRYLTSVRPCFMLRSRGSSAWMHQSSSR